MAFVVVLMLTSRSTGAPLVGKPAAIGFGVMRAATPPCGATRRSGRVGAGQQDHEPLVGHGLQVGLQASDVVSAPDRDRDGRVGQEPLARRGDRALDEPGARQPATVPGERRAKVAQRLGLALARHAAVRELVEVARQHVEAVRVVAEQVGLDQHVGDDRRPVGSEAGLLEQPRRERTQLLGPVTPLLRGLLHELDAWLGPVSAPACGSRSPPCPWPRARCGARRRAASRAS